MGCMGQHAVDTKEGARHLVRGTVYTGVQEQGGVVGEHVEGLLPVTLRPHTPSLKGQQRVHDAEWDPLAVCTRAHAPCVRYVRGYPHSVPHDPTHCNMLHAGGTKQSIRATFGGRGAPRCHRGYHRGTRGSSRDFG